MQRVRKTQRAVQQAPLPALAAHLTSSLNTRMPLPRYSTIFSGWAADEAAVGPAVPCCPAAAAAAVCSPAAGAHHPRSKHRYADAGLDGALSSPPAAAAA